MSILSVTVAPMWHSLHLTFLSPAMSEGLLTRSNGLGPKRAGAAAITFAPSHARLLQFSAEAFTVLNHTNFQIGHNAINDPSFGQAGGTGDPRNLQFAFKLMF